MNETKRNTDTAAFKKWFGKSKVVDEDGDPLVVYHGTDKDFTKFKTHEGAGGELGAGAYFTNNPETAGVYGEEAESEDYRSGARILPVYLSLQNPLDVSDLDYIPSRKKPIKQGYDGIIEKVGDKMQIVAFYPTQIKSIFNRGTWDGNNKDILYEEKTNPADELVGLGKLYREKYGNKSAEEIIKNIPALYGQSKEIAKEEAAKIKPTNKLRRTIQEKKEQAIYNLIDSNDPLKVIQGYFKINDEGLDVYQIERLRGKREAGLIGEFRRDVVKPIIKQMANTGITFEDLDKYRHAMHAEEANARLKRVHAKEVLKNYAEISGDDELKKTIRKISEGVRKKIDVDNKSLPEVAAEFRAAQEKYLDILDNVQPKTKEELKFIQRWNKNKQKLSGMTNEQASAIKKEYSGNKEIEAIRKQFQDIDDKKIDILVASGELTKEEAQAMRGAYKYYAPLYREGVGGLPASGRKIGPLGSPVQIREGSTKEVSNISAHTIANYEGAISRSLKAERNKVLYKLVSETQTKPGITSEEERVWWIEDVPKRPDYDAQGNLTYYRDTTDPPDGVLIKANGNLKTIRVNLASGTMMRFLDSMKQAPEKNGLIVGLSAINRYLAMVNTSLSPEFILSNFTRDLQTASIHLQDTELKGFQRKVLKQVPSAIKGIWNAEHSNATDGFSGWYRDFEKNGGKIGWASGYEQIKDITKRLDKEFNEASGNARAMRTARFVLETIEHGNTAVENGVRLATYKTLYENLKKDGVDEKTAKQKAAFVASNLTVDFTKKGKYGGTINALYLFANAGIQGNVRMIEAIARSPRVRKIVGGIILGGFVMNMLGMLMGGDDDDGIPYYDKLRESDPGLFERNIVFMIPDSNGKHIKIPMPWGYNAFYNLGHEISNATYKNMNDNRYDPIEGMARVVSGFANAFNPLASATILQTLSPTVFDPFVVVGENKQWHGGPLMPEKNPFARIPKPDSERYFKSVSEPSKAIAATLNKLTGGDKIKSGVIDISPETIDMMYETVTGSTGRFLRNTLLLPMADSPRNIPFARRFYGEKSEYIDREIYHNTVNDILTAKEQRESGSDRVDQGLIKYIPLMIRTETELLRLYRIKKKAEDRGVNTALIDKKIEKLQSNLLKAVGQ